MTRDPHEERPDPELTLLRDGLVGGGLLDAASFAAIEAAWRAEGGSMIDLLARHEAISATTARTLHAIRKGYLRAPVGPLLAGFELPAALRPAPPAGPAEPAAADEPEGVLGPMPEWNSIAPAPAPAPTSAPPSEPSARRAKGRDAAALDRLALVDAPAAGGQIGPFTLRAIANVSATSVVYRAYDERGRQPVMIKLLRRDVPSRERERLVAEARILARLTHPNVIRLLGAGEHQGSPYLILENLFAIGLDEHLEANGLVTPKFILQTAICAIRGLGAAQRAGVTHRDVKPANLLLYNSDGRVKVADFGLASDGPSLGEDAQTLRGTPAYMAPEAVVGAQKIDHRADMYSLGATLFEAATGHPPFVRSTALETLRAHINDRAPAVHEEVVGFPQPLSQVIARLLRKRPEERFAAWSEAEQTVEAIARLVNSPIADAVNRAVGADESGTTLASLYGRRR